MFDVNTFAVLSSGKLDEMLLHAAADAEPREYIEAAALRAGHKEDKVSDRFNHLLQHCFFLHPDQICKSVSATEPTGYATFMVNVAQRCNLTCSYCYVAEGRFDYPEMPIARMNRVTAEKLVGSILNQFPGFDTYGFHFYGGEPLLNFKVIRQIVRQTESIASKTGIDTDYHITTNGTLITPEIADFMEKHRFQVYLSIDGDEKTHNEERTYKNGEGSYQEVMDALELLKQRPGIHLIGSSVIRKGVELSDAMEKLACHGTSQCKAERVRLRDDDSKALSGDAHEAYIRDIAALTDHYVEALTSGRKPLDFRLSSKILGILLKRRKEFFCPAGSRMFGIAANGEIYPCALHVGRAHSRLGSLDTGLDIERRERFRQSFSPSAQTNCSNCWTRHLCGGGCSAMVDRFEHEDCNALRAESEAAIAVYQEISEIDEVLLYCLVSPELAKWVHGQSETPNSAIKPANTASIAPQ